MANMTEKDSQWLLDLKLESKEGLSKVLKTADTYVDKNIAIDISVDPVQFNEVVAGAISATVSTEDATYTQAAETPYAVVIAADGHVNKTEVTVAQAGFADADDKITIAAADATQDTQTLYIKEGSLEVKTEGSVSATAEGGIVLGAASATAPAGYSIKVESTGSVGVANAGWVDAEHNEAIDVSADKYYAIAKMAVKNAATSGVEYEEVQGPALVSGDYLYIDAGYTEPIKISLADLVPDAANVVGTDGKSDLIYKDVTVYDKDGNLITGTMGDATLTPITAEKVEATISTVTVGAKTGSTYAITGSGAISGDTSVAIATRGLAETSLKQTGSIEGTAELNSTIAAGVLQAAPETADLTVTPVIKKETSSALSGNITTTLPAGKKYVAVSADAIEAATTITASVKSEGYVKDETATTSVTAGSAASGSYYIEINEGSHEAVKDGDATIVKAKVVEAIDKAASAGFEGNLTAGILSAAPSTGDYITISTKSTPTAGSVTQNIKCTSTEGYITATEKTVSVEESVAIDTITEANVYIKVYDGSII